MDDLNLARRKHATARGAERERWERAIKSLGRMLAAQTGADRQPVEVRERRKHSEAFSTNLKQVGNRQVRVVASTPTVDRDGDRITPGAFNLATYRKNPVILRQHDPKRPIARASSVDVVDGKLRAVIQFPQPGISQDSDETYELVKAGILNGISVGFRAEKVSFPNDLPAPGMQVDKADLLEISIVSVPSNPEATIVERAHGR
jgi:HK97 family phage prohead protease